MNHKKVALLAFGILCMGLGLWILLRTRQKKSSTTSFTSISEVKESSPECTFPIKYGNTKACGLVAELQKKLNAKLRATVNGGWILTDVEGEIAVDGKWGPQTQSALEQFGFTKRIMSENEYLTLTGFYGPQTA